MCADTDTIYNVPISHGEGRFYAPAKVVDNLIKYGQVATQYVDLDGQPTYDILYNPNGSVCAIDEKKSSKDLRDALNAGKRIIVTTLQKFPVIYEEVDDTKGKRFAVIVDEAHSSQTGTSAMKLKVALADTSDALKEYAELEGKAEDEVDANDPN